jgi:hypothetical protein
MLWGRKKGGVTKRTKSCNPMVTPSHVVLKIYLYIYIICNQEIYIYIYMYLGVFRNNIKILRIFVYM